MRPLSDVDQSGPGTRVPAVRICPACGVVNPSGPSETCPHVQLVRIDDPGRDLESRLDEVAAARRRYTELVGRLKAEVKALVREGRAEVETPGRERARDEEALGVEVGPGGELHLVHPVGVGSRAEPEPRPPKKKRRKASLPRVDPRQLDLLAQSPPEGDA